MTLQFVAWQLRAEAVKQCRAWLVIWSWCPILLLSACSNGQSGIVPATLHLPTLDGSAPSAGLIQGRDGNFYGMTANGGQFNNGTVFSITPDGVETVLYSFAGGMPMERIQRDI